MQEERRNTPKLGTVRKGSTLRTPGIIGSMSDTVTASKVTSRRRVTMMPGDITQLQNNQSIVSSDVQKKTDTEYKDVELGLLYDEYLQTIMMDLIMKKKTEERKCLIVTQLATVAQEIDQDLQKLIKIKTRERDIINFTLAQKETDAQVIAATRYTEDETFKIIKDTLSKLQFFLEPLDILRCNGIILPETQNEWNETEKILIKCSDALKNITSLIGSKSETYCAVNVGLKNFAEVYNEIKDLQRKLDKTLCNLQILMLKNASLSLTCNESE